MKKLTLALLLLLVIATPALAQLTEHHARLTFVTGKQPAADYCRPGTLTLWYNGSNLKYGTSSDCSTWPNFPSADGVTLADGGALVTVGAYTGTFTFTGATGVTFPTAGTLATRAGTETLTNKTLSLTSNTVTGTSAEFATAISNETGSGLVVFGTSPTLTTPNIGVATATSVNKLTLTTPATGATLTLTDGKTLAVTHTLTLSGTDDTVMTFPSVSASLAPLTSPSFTTPALGVATATSVTAGAGTAAVPSFGTAAGVGMFLSAANAIGFSTDSTERWVINASGTFLPASNGTLDIGNGSSDPRDINITRNVIAKTANGASWTRGVLSESITLSTVGATTDSTADLLPANSIIESAVCAVTTTITTATDWAVGDATTAARFAAANATMTAGATSIGLAHMQGAVSTDATGPVQVAAAKLRITTSGTPGAGVVRCTVFYSQFVAPTD